MRAASPEYQMLCLANGIHSLSGNSVLLALQAAALTGRW